MTASCFLFLVSVVAVPAQGAVPSAPAHHRLVAPGRTFPPMPFEHTFVARDSFPASLARCGQWMRLRVEFGKNSATLFSEGDPEDFRDLSVDSLGGILSGVPPNRRLIGRYDSRNGVLLWKGGVYNIE